MPQISYLTIFFGLATLISLTIAVIQYRSAARVKDILDNYTKGLLEDTRRIVAAGQKSGNTKLQTELKTLREKLITLDIVNRSLTKDKIDRMEREEKMNKAEADEYRKLVSR